MAGGGLFDPRTALLARHAQHVIARWRKRKVLADAAYHNLLAAAWSTLPALATGLLAWRFQLDGQKLKGVLLLHLMLACTSSVMIWLVWWEHLRARRRNEAPPGRSVVIELVGVGIVALTGHLGGFLSGVNGPG